MQQIALDWVKTIASSLLSWPVITLVVVLIFRRQLMNLLGNLRTAKLGPVELELTRIAEKGQVAVDTLDRITAVMAESRLLELEITDGIFGKLFTEEQRHRMDDHIKQLRGLTKNNISATDELMDRR